MNTSIVVLSGVVAIAGVGCGGISDCKDDGAKCAEMLNANGEKCAQAYQLRQSDKKRKACENAIKVVRKGKVKAAIAGLVKILQVPESSNSGDKHRQHAARALGDIGDPSAVPGLIAAINFEAGTSNDPRDKNANRSNEQIATSLGKLGDKAATDKLIQLMERGKTNFVILKAVRALGELKDPKAVGPLAKIALTHDNKFMRKNAVIAMGDVGDLSATDTLVQMMFIEYQGVSFFREASFALYKLGPGVADAVLKTMAGENKSVNDYFEKSGGIKDTAIRAKCGIILADLRDKRAIEPLKAAFEDALKKQDPVVIVQASNSLGVLGAKAAVPMLAKQMLVLDASQRGPIMRALNQLGDRSVVAKMIEGMTVDHFVKSCVKQEYGTKDQCTKDTPSLHGAQKAAADQASNLGGAEHVEAFKKVLAVEKDEKIKTYFEKRLARLEAAGECKTDAPCWVKKLEDKNPMVREKAAWELKRLADANTIRPLEKALGDKNREARSAAIFSYWAYGDNKAIPAIEKRLEDEVSSADYMVVNEDLKRLLVHLKRMK